MSMTTEIVVTLQCDAPYCMRSRRIYVPNEAPAERWFPVSVSAFKKAERLGWGYSPGAIEIDRCPFCTEKEGK